MPSITYLFIAIFASQIFFLSYYYPKKFVGWMSYVLKTYPPEEYPKFYPKSYGFNTAEIMKRNFKVFKIMNFIIVLIGLAILVGMVKSNYTPAHKGGDEIFVLFYFLLQAIPHMYAEVFTYKHYKAMRDFSDEKVKKADLTPRRLFDYISPLYILTAFVVYCGWLVFFLSNQPASEPWRIEVYITLFTTLTLNTLYGIIIANLISGKKIDPYQAPADRFNMVRRNTKLLVISSIGMSLFIGITQAVDIYDLEVYDPVIASAYFQLIIIFGAGMYYRDPDMKTIDFSVYKTEEKSQI